MMKKIVIPLLLVLLVSCIPRNKAPKCKIETPLGGAVYSKGDTIQVYIIADDEDGFVDEVRLSLDGVGVVSMNTFPYIHMLETAQLEIGTHILNAVAFDDLRKETDAEIEFTITSGLPKVRTLQPVLVSGNSFIVGGSISDNGGAAISKAGVMWSDVPYDVADKNELVAQVNNGSFTATLSNLEHATYYIAAFAENENGRSLGEILDFTVPALPVIEIVEPLDGSQYVQGDSINVAMNASDEDGTISIVRVFMDSKPVTAIYDFPYTFIYPTAGLAIGGHMLKVEAEDNDGNKAVDTAHFTLNAGR